MDDRENKVSVGSGVGFLGLLTVLFIALKLTGYISWSWVWVLAPLWIDAIIVLILSLVLIHLYAVRGKGKE